MVARVVSEDKFEIAEVGGESGENLRSHDVVAGQFVGDAQPHHLPDAPVQVGLPHHREVAGMIRA